MAFKTILAITAINQSDRDLRLVADLCDETHAHMSVLVLAFAAPPPVGEYAAMASAGWAEEREADLKRLEERIAAVTSFLAARETSADIASEYPEIAWADEVIGRRARCTDLTLIGPELLATKTLKAKTIEGALFSSGRPLLLVPEGAQPALRPKRVLVAWDGRIEASRALRESLDLLVSANEVRLVLVDPAESELGAEPGADAATYLARHGIKVTVDRLPRSGHTVADVLRRHAVDMAAELLVMGAYGHSRLRERIFGGVTKSMLDEPPPLPILMAR